jgi:hypothetical protein
MNDMFQMSTGELFINLLRSYALIVQYKLDPLVIRYPPPLSCQYFITSIDQARTIAEENAFFFV